MSFGVGNAGRSVQANLKLKGKRKTYFDRAQEKSTGSGNIYLKDLRTKMTPQKFFIFQKKLQRRKRKLRIKRMTVVVIFMSVLVLLLYYFNGGPL
jgi:hypothetical protein